MKKFEESMDSERADRIAKAGEIPRSAKVDPGNFASPTSTDPKKKRRTYFPRK